MLLSFDASKYKTLYKNRGKVILYLQRFVIECQSNFSFSETHGPLNYLFTISSQFLLIERPSQFKN